jgi:tetratricopeptide (TPR) repeat protein
MRGLAAWQSLPGADLEAIQREIGLTAVSTARDEALIARYAGDPEGCVRALGPACDELRAAGETGYLSLDLAELADGLYELGRYDEAEEAVREAERLTQASDISGQAVWRRVSAKLRAHEGAAEEAVGLVRTAIKWAESSPEVLGDAYRDLATVERLLGRPDRAEEALERALAACTRKGLAPMAARTRAELAELRADV